MLFDKATHRRRLVGTRAAFVKADYNTFWDEDGERREFLEDEWQRVENAAIPQVREVVGGASLTANSAAAIKSLAAMHFARSPSLHEASEHLAPSILASEMERAERDPETAAVFEAERGRPPEPGELRALVQQLAAEFVSSNLSRVTSMVNMHNRVLEILEPLHLQLIRPRQELVGFAFCDTPFLNHDRKSGLLGPADGLAVGDSDLLLMPLARYCCVTFTKADEGSVEAPASLVDEINLLVWRSARRFVASHPGEHPAAVVPNYAAWIAGR